MERRTLYFLSRLIFCLADKKSYALSIRDFDLSKNDVIIKHYRIRKMDDGGCYISPKRTFPTIIELIEHYKREGARRHVIRK